MPAAGPMATGELETEKVLTPDELIDGADIELLDVGRRRDAGVLQAERAYSRAADDAARGGASHHDA